MKRFGNGNVSNNDREYLETIAPLLSKRKERKRNGK